MCVGQAERETITKTLLHAADISNPAKPWDVAKAWSDRVIQEFFAQGEKEKEEGLPVSPNMDAATTQPARVSLNFIDFIVAPLFVALTTLLPKAQMCCDCIGIERRFVCATALCVPSNRRLTQPSSRRVTFVNRCKPGQVFSYAASIHPGEHRLGHH